MCLFAFLSKETQSTHRPRLWSWFLQKENCIRMKKIDGMEWQEKWIQEKKTRNSTNTLNNWILSTSNTKTTQYRNRWWIFLLNIQPFDAFLILWYMLDARVKSFVYRYRRYTVQTVHRSLNFIYENYTLEYKHTTTWIPATGMHCNAFVGFSPSPPRIDRMCVNVKWMIYTNKNQTHVCFSFYFFYFGFDGTAAAMAKVNWSLLSVLSWSWIRWERRRAARFSPFFLL